MEKESSFIKPYVMHPYAYAYGRSTETLSNYTLYKELETTATQWPQRLALISDHENIKKTFSELLFDVHSLSRAFRHILHIVPGDVIAIMTTNCYNFVVAQYTCAQIGAILCPVNAYYTGPELEFCIKKVNPKVLIIPASGSKQEMCGNKIFDVFTEIKGNLNGKVKHLVLLDKGSCESSAGQGKPEDRKSQSMVRKVEEPKVHQFEDLIKTGSKLSDENMHIEDFIDADDSCMLFFTSGTTGSPKAASLTHFNVTNNARLFGKRLGLHLDEQVSICVPVPIFHVIASILGTITLSTLGVAVAFANYRYDVESVIQTLLTHKCTHFMGVPAMLIDMMNYVEEKGIKVTTLKGIITAGTTVPLEVVQRFCRLFPSVKHVDIVYGTTETSPIITTPWFGDPLEKSLDNVGIPLDLTEVKLVHQETGKIVKIGEKGELLTRGPHVMQGYWNDKEQTSKAINEGGWYNTGDLATMDEEGYIRIVGRTKEIIIRGGVKVYPREIEEVLVKHPLVENVAVCGIPDERLGEEICAWIKVRDPNKRLTVDDVRHFCKGQLAYFKIPRKVLIVNEFPMTKSGKVQKFKMSKESAKLLATQQ